MTVTRIVNFEEFRLHCRDFRTDRLAQEVKGARSVSLLLTRSTDVREKPENTAISELSGSQKVNIKTVFGWLAHRESRGVSDPAGTPHQEGPAALIHSRSG